ncbi:MAG: YchJ family protein [Deltaproteobacteria bacterium]|nr:YchJ family protein [Deltaproteobacteria bacterium]
MDCPCGSGQAYEHCCEAFIKGDRLPETAEQLMRSRYSAHAVQAIPYLLETIHPDFRGDWDEEGARTWSQSAVWQGMDVVAAEAGGPADEQGIVEFIARFSIKGEEMQHHERSVFEKIAGRWYFKDGEMMKPKQVRREAPKTGRNDPCPCGSGKKYKKCCGA